MMLLWAYEIIKTTSICLLGLFATNGERARREVPVTTGDAEAGPKKHGGVVFIACKLNFLESLIIFVYTSGLIRLG